MWSSLVPLVALCLSIGLSSPVENTTIYQRDSSPYKQLDGIFGTTVPKDVDKPLGPYVIEWNKDTTGSTKDLIQLRCRPSQGTVLVVTGTRASWTFGMTIGQRNDLNNPELGANAKSVKESEKFQSHFTYAILGEPSKKGPGEVEMVDNPLSKFREYLEKSDEEPVSLLVISPIDAKASDGKMQKMQNEALIYAMAWEISSMLGGDLSTAWIPSPLNDADSRTCRYGWRRSYEAKLALDGFSVPGQSVEAWYGLHKVIDAGFPANPLTAGHYGFKSAKDLNLVPIPPENDEPANVNVAEEFDKLWNEPGHIPLMNGDEKVTTAQTVITSASDPPLHHDNERNPAVVITVVTREFSYTLLVPTSTELVQGASRARFNERHDFIALENQVRESLRSVPSESCHKNGILDVFVVPTLKKGQFSYKPFTRAAATMVVTTVQEMGLEWSGKIRVAKPKALRGEQRILVSHSKRQDSGIGGPGVSSRLYHDLRFVALWEIADSGQVMHRYVDPRGYFE